MQRFHLAQTLLQLLQLLLQLLLRLLLRRWLPVLLPSCGAAASFVARLQLSDLLLLGCDLLP